MFYKLLRVFLFRFDAETIHRRVMGWTSLVMRLGVVRRLVESFFRVDDPALRQTLWGIDFANPVGLGAGFDKNAEHFNDLDALGFGFIEIGTVTGEGQPGNERPRMFRLRWDEGLLNRMGFNNAGSQAVAQRLEGADIQPILGVNIGKTKRVELADAPADYEKSFRRLFDYARYFVVNVSSPNTPGLRELQNKEPLTELLLHLQFVNEQMAAERGADARPILLKIAPDISEALLDDILSVVDDCNIDGIIATNTTIERAGLKTPGVADLGPGGVSGKPLQDRALEVIRTIYRKTGGRLPIIGVGGIFTGDDALAAIRAGASLVQVWTGFVYEGPSTVRNINRRLVAACREHGWSTIAEATGADVDLSAPLPKPAHDELTYPLPSDPA